MAERPDIRPQYPSGSIGRAEALGVFLVKPDGSYLDPRDIDVGEGGGGGAAKQPTLTSASGTIDEANVSQEVWPEDEDRREGLFLNSSDVDQWVNNTGPAVIDDPDSYKLAPGDSFSSPYPNALNVICATAGKRFTAKTGG